MKHSTRLQLGIVISAITALFLIVGTNVMAQTKKDLSISATALGTNQQLGRLISVDVRISAYSTAEDRKGLLEAFGEKGSEGLANALDKMSSKGRIAITGTLGFDLKYVREFKMPDGNRKIRFVTDRPVKFAELWSSSRSMDYSLSMGEIIISNTKGKSTGTLVPAAKFKLNKDGEIEIEAFQNPWNLTNIKVWK